MLEEKIEIYRGTNFYVYELNNFRTLAVVGENRWVHSEFKIDDPDSLHNLWSISLIRPLIFLESPRDVILIGAGGGALLKFIHKHWPQTKLTALEIDAEMVDIARNYFEMPLDNENLQVIVADGVSFIEKFEDQCDFIISNAYDEKNGLVKELHTEKHFRKCHHILRDDGVMTINIFRPGPEFGKTYIQMLQSIFVEVYVTVLTPEQCIVTLCKSKLLPRFAAISERAIRLEPTLMLNLPNFLTSFPELPELPTSC